MKTKLLCLLSVFFLFFPTFHKVSSETSPKHIAFTHNSFVSENKVAYVIDSLSENQKLVVRQIDAIFGTSTKMKKIAYCESGFKQFKSNGELLESRTGDFGVLQVNEKTWDKKAKELGLDYKNSAKDNIKMAKYIYDQSGISAWTCAKLI